MRTIGAYEAKTHLPRLLDEVAAGETIAIAKRGRVVAVLSPPPKPHLDVLKAFARWKEQRPSLNLPPGQTLRDLIEEGRDRLEIPWLREEEDRDREAAHRPAHVRFGPSAITDQSDRLV